MLDDLAPLPENMRVSTFFSSEVLLAEAAQAVQQPVREASRPVRNEDKERRRKMRYQAKQAASSSEEQDVSVPLVVKKKKTDSQPIRVVQPRAQLVPKKADKTEDIAALQRHIAALRDVLNELPNELVYADLDAYYAQVRSVALNAAVRLPTKKVRDKLKRSLRQMQALYEEQLRRQRYAILQHMMNLSRTPQPCMSAYL